LAIIGIPFFVDLKNAEYSGWPTCGLYTGDAPNAMLQESSGLPIGSESFFVFSKQGTNDRYVNVETPLFKDETDAMPSAGLNQWCRTAIDGCTMLRPDFASPGQAHQNGRLTL
jgi:hypothetical protein